MTDTCKDLDIIATAHRPARAHRGASRAGAAGDVGGERRGGRARSSPTTALADRASRGRARPVRQRAPASDRLQAAQRRAARVRGAPRDARERVRRRGGRDAARRTAARRRRRSTRRSASTTSSRSCARAAASCEAALAAQLPKLVDRGRPARATCTPTRRSRTGAARSRTWRRPRAQHGYQYLAITDHSASHGFGNDVQADELLRQVERVRTLNERGWTGLHGAGRLGGEHQHRRIARLRGRRARRARLGRRLRAHVLSHGGGRDDRAHDGCDGPSPTSTRSAIRPAA